ncbi:MAG: hypothetical protein U1E28_22170 [Beijerinckiaceae bacterium]
MRKYLPILGFCLLAAPAVAQEAAAPSSAPAAACSFPCFSTPKPEAASTPEAAAPADQPAVRKRHARRHGIVARDPRSRRVAALRPRETVTEEVIAEYTLPRPKKVRTIRIERPGSMPVEDKAEPAQEASREAPAEAAQPATTPADPAPAPVPAAAAPPPSPFGGLSRLGLQ